MTNEEAKELIKSQIDIAKDNISYCPNEEGIEALNLAIKALEEQPSEDCISREAIQDYIAEYLSQYLYDDVRSAVEVIDAYIGDMPSVTPQPKKGKWKEIYAESEGSDSWIEFQCPHCGYLFGMESGQYNWHYGDAIPWKACPMCGGLAEHKPYKEDSE